MRDARWAGTSGGGIAAGVTVLVASMVGLPAVAGAVGQGVPTCLGEPATIVADGEETLGTDGDDVIVGRAGADEIDPGGGRDLVCALGGWDLVTDDDAARDRIQLGAASDIFVTGPGAKAWIDGGAPHSAGATFADDIVYGGQSGVTVDLRAQSDSRGNQLLGMESVVGTPARDVITGTSVDNELSGRGGPDVIRGLAGDDELELRGQREVWSVAGRLIGGPGDDRLDLEYRRGRTVMLGGAGDDSVYGGHGPDRLNGGRGDDHLGGQGGPDRYRGGPGADHLYAGWGDDTMAGGPGRDVWSNWDSGFGTNGERVTTVRIAAGTIRDRIGEELFHDTLSRIEVYRGFRDIEHVYGSARRDVVNTGTTEGDLVDRIYGRGGNDRLIAPRHGWIDGGAGSDYCRAEQKRDCER